MPGGSPYEGLERPLLRRQADPPRERQVRRPELRALQRHPLPTIHYGLIIDDLSTSVDKEEIFYGDKAPAKQMPISWYDFSGRLVRQSVTDPNGMYEVMLPLHQPDQLPEPGRCVAGVLHARRERPVDAGSGGSRPGSRRPQPAADRPEPGLRSAVPRDLDAVRGDARPHDDDRPRGLDDRRRRERARGAAVASREVPPRYGGDAAAVRGRPGLRDPAGASAPGLRRIAPSRSVAPASVPAARWRS